MKLINILEMCNEPIIVLNNNNIGHTSEISSEYMKKLLKLKVCWLGTAGKYVAIYLEDK